MNRIKKVLLGLALAFVCVVTLASCSKVSQSYADKINEAAEKKEYVAVADAKDALGDECFDASFFSLAGSLIAVKGYKNDMTYAELEKKMSEADENTKFEAIVIFYAGSNCIYSVYVSGTAAELSNKLEEAGNEAKKRLTSLGL